jgi:FkbM family methyltransferase
MLRFLKSALPLSVKNQIRALLGEKNLYKSTIYPIDYSLFGRSLKFYFIAPPKLGIKAQKGGIENNIIRRIYTFSNEKPSGVIVDVGMNFGFLSMAWSKAMPHHRIISFEVHPGIIQNVKDAMLQSEISNMEIIESPVSNVAGVSVDFYAGIYTGSDTEKNNRKITLTTTTLDQFFNSNANKVHAIKIDTDKFDFEVLEGAVDLINRDRPMIAIEINQDARIVPFLLGFGYFLYDMRGEEIVSKDIDLTDPRFVNIFAYPEKILVTK